MEQDQSQQPGLFEMDLDNEARFSFYETAKWARFFGIVAIVAVSLLFFFFILFGSRIASTFGMDNLFPAQMGGALIIAAALVAAVCSILFYYLFKASNLIRSAINTNNQELFNDGLNSLKIFFIVYGIVSIVLSLFSLLKST